ncbi:MAG: ABC transporter ATP-binding protein [Acidobacteriota bacterium]
MLLRIRDLSFSYGAGLGALRSVSLEVEAGEKIGIVGANGAGKSTLLLHLNGVLEGEGEVFVDDRRLEASSLAEIRRNVGLVFQDPDDQLFSSTVFEDVAFGPLYMGLPEELVRQRVAAALAAVGMERMADRAPHRMSLGEKKLAAIATVLSMDPSILALDEPTSGLDARATRRITQLLAGLDLTLLVATHDLSLVRRILPRTIVMDGGEIVADGPTEEVLSDRTLLDRHGLI